MSDTLVTAASIAVVALVTWFTRGLPYLLFGGKKDPPGWITYLGSVLPASIMVILVIYCLRNIQFALFPHGLAELCSVTVVAGLQLWKSNTFLSILAGTACYMILIRTIFPL